LLDNADTDDDDLFSAPPQVPALIRSNSNSGEHGEDDMAEHLDLTTVKMVGGRKIYGHLRNVRRPNKGSSSSDAGDCSFTDADDDTNLVDTGVNEQGDGGPALPVPGPHGHGPPAGVPGPPADVPGPHDADGAQQAEGAHPPDGDQHGSDDDYGYHATPDPSSDSDDSLGRGGSSSSSDEDLADSIRRRLTEWLLQNNIAGVPTDHLLKILIDAGLDYLPKTSRTLLRTPRSVIDVRNICGGEFKYFGIAPKLHTILTHNPNFAENTDTLKLKFNVDGLPLYKSTNGQFWPILCKLEHFPPFVVALFYGTKKPTDVESFFEEFTHELSELEDNDLVHDDKHYVVRFHCLICDAPARCFVKCVKGHTGYWACEKCKVKGNYFRHTMIYPPDRVFDKRTDQEFANMMYFSGDRSNVIDNHQQGRCPLLVCPRILLVSQTVVEYMHNVALGAWKRFLVFLLRGPPECRLSAEMLNVLCERLESLRGKLPREFARSPRTLRDLDRWKATELRSSLLYTGYVFLRTPVVSQPMYQLYLKLAVAMSILLLRNDEMRNRFLDFARNLILEFIRDSAELLTERYVVYNIHGLQHLPDDVEYFGVSLNELSAFPFENYLQSVKKMIRGTRNPIVQASKRIHEAENAKFVKKYKTMKTYISSVPKDSMFFIEEENAFAMVQRKRRDDRLDVLVLPMDQTENFFETPCPSKVLHLCLVRDLDNQPVRREIVRTQQLTRKVVIIPALNQRDFILIPMLHEIEVTDYH
jgi:hypothetical protein